MLSKSGSAGKNSTPHPGKRRVTHTAKYNGELFHLHQVVVPNTDSENDGQHEWIVVSLEDGLKLASPDFEHEREYLPETVPNSIEPQVAVTGEPIFGY